MWCWSFQSSSEAFLPSTALQFPVTSVVSASSLRVLLLVFCISQTACTLLERLMQSSALQNNNEDPTTNQKLSIFYNCWRRNPPVCAHMSSFDLPSSRTFLPLFLPCFIPTLSSFLNDFFHLALFPSSLPSLVSSLHPGTCKNRIE